MPKHFSLCWNVDVELKEALVFSTARTLGQKHIFIKLINVTTFSNITVIISDKGKVFCCNSNINHFFRKIYLHLIDDDLCHNFRFQEQTFTFSLTPQQASFINSSLYRDEFGRPEYKKQVRILILEIKHNSSMFILTTNILIDGHRLTKHGTQQLMLMLNFPA
jgi:hypothetical protein